MCRSFAATDHLVGVGFGTAALAQLLKRKKALNAFALYYGNRITENTNN